MKTRIITAIITFPVFFIIVLLGGNLLAFGMMAVSLVGLFEFYNALKGRIKPIATVGAIETFIYYMLIMFMGYNSRAFFVTFILFLLALFSILVIRYPKYNVIDLSCTLFGVLYVPVLLSIIYAIRMGNSGQYLVWFIFLSAWGSDTFAYFVGRLLGKRKMAPKISPKKTVEGLFGGIIGAIVVSLAFVYVLELGFSIYVPNIKLIAVLAGIFGSVFGVVGDLSASAIKRHFEIKDFGKVLPGHGGILDRFDSILFTAPVVYIIIMVVDYGCSLVANIS